jgi:hypothetical protein
MIAYFKHISRPTALKKRRGLAGKLSSFFVAKRINDTMNGSFLEMSGNFI